MWLYHAAIESDEVLRNITTDQQGKSVVELPSYVDKVNKDYRYNLTVIGTFSQAIIKEEFDGNKFVIMTEDPNVKVSWELTGVRNDKRMQEKPFEAERPKEKNEEPYGEGEER